MVVHDHHSMEGYTYSIDPCRDVQTAQGSSCVAAHSTVAIDWDSDTKKMCYDDQEAEVSVTTSNLKWNNSLIDEGTLV